MSGTLLIADWKDKLLDGTYEEYMEEMVEKHDILGPFIGIGMPFMESFLPFLPFFVFVFANVAAFGLFKGFLFSWIGSTVGSIVVYFILRSFKEFSFIKRINKNKQVKRITSRVEKQGFGIIFLLLCFPFSPSSLVNIVAAFSSVKTWEFIFAVIFGKSIMVFSLAYVGSNIFSFAKHPVKALIIGLCIAIIWYGGKLVEKQLERRATYS